MESVDRSCVHIRVYQRKGKTNAGALTVLFFFLAKDAHPQYIAWTLSSLGAIDDCCWACYSKLTSIKIRWLQLEPNPCEGMHWEGEYIFNSSFFFSTLQQYSMIHQNTCWKSSAAAAAAVKGSSKLIPCFLFCEWQSWKQYHHQIEPNL